MAILILMLASATLAGLFAWFVALWLQKEYARYRSVYQHDAVHGLADFFLFLDPGQLWGLNVVLALMIVGFGLVAGGHPVVAGMAGMLALIGPRWALGHARRRRLRRLDQQLPDFLLALAGALQAGSGLQSGLRQVVQHTKRPLAQEWGLLLQQQRMGMSLNDALDTLHARAATESVGLVVAAIKVASQTGGGLAETLTRISATLRTRLQLLGKIRALTSQGRMQSWIMASLPLLLAAAIYSLDPEAMSPLWQSAVGWGVLVLIAILELAGIVLVRRVVDIEV